MSKKYDWYYVTNAKSHKTGNMICTHCNKLITQGEYRYRETSNAYLVQHRKCSEQDTHWKINDSLKEKQLKQILIKLKAYKDFKNLWDIDSLDDEIREMEYFINKKNEI